MRTFIICAFLASAGVAEAHVSISSGPAAANKSQKITFSVGHGCTGQDTIAIRVVIPTGIASVRALVGDFGFPTVEKDSGGAVTAVSWRKPVTELYEGDDGYYDVTIRARTPDAPFTTIAFVVEQTCRDFVTGDETVVVWGGPDEDPAELVIVPSRMSGWNKFTVPIAVVEADLPKYLGDALIVWRGMSAYSSNANTAMLIAATPGVSALAGDLAANDEIWVRY